ncbi:hypothetical protein GDO78_008205 [Eleutherodactylus coqui]|uniref:Uncharacterized protein n=1 Tax=Eleutherodactylus coqui TaxID=57060 RepID=A0A8J6FCC5_ELECQ|nr:hypothetical protein GDO78_008205 [Eleutherodactylus coqui]
MWSGRDIYQCVPIEAFTWTIVRRTESTHLTTIGLALQLCGAHKDRKCPIFATCFPYTPTAALKARSMHLGSCERATSSSLN